MTFLVKKEEVTGDVDKSPINIESYGQHNFEVAGIKLRISRYGFTPMHYTVKADGELVGMIRREGNFWVPIKSGENHRLMKTAEAAARVVFTKWLES